MDVVRKLILEKLEEKGLTMSEASLKIGKNHAYLQQFLKRGYPLELPEKSRLPLAQLLEVPEEKLRGPSSLLPAREYVKLTGTVADAPRDERMSPNVHKSIDTASLVPPVFGDRDLPVFGTAQGGSGALIVTDQAVDYVVRPAPLLRVRDGYGMIVTGDSMSPKIENGDTVLVNPHLPWRSGDTCVFRCHQDDGTVLAIVKRLRRYNDETWFVSQFNPAKDFSLKRSEWQICHVTVGSYFTR